MDDTPQNAHCENGRTMTFQEAKEYVIEKYDQLFKNLASYDTEDKDDT